MSNTQTTGTGSGGHTERKNEIIATANVNVRTGNGKGYQKVGSLAEGDILPFVAISANGWYAVEYKDAIRWVSGNYVKEVTKK